ncbi:hypothetical protein GUITHDRAFT_148778 [Guillardia theta CCMP2712]|uniref:Uncharacterized protein n=1 Tax=Guillardia theta (strain CCMP2712) TaxID=905079 RepID=L1I8H3_GUITC|nr:hypothetical protein GUITHDRAFT_148778 [Guillardia theta CCMP2712]EKX32194.1 hypothetical protein GUITHDRAFT_148778 [Guillardia theta CCMP2712]|eukprot:XP_005819174.1 hypothetical protein GUITHDRAFT_148778 [Guillardia theta CCMP2712]
MSARMTNLDIMEIHKYMQPRYGTQKRLKRLSNSVILYYEDMIATVFKDIRLDQSPYRNGYLFDYEFMQYGNYKIILVTATEEEFSLRGTKELEDVLGMANSVDMAHWCYTLLYGYTHRFRVNVDRVQFVCYEGRRTSVFGFWCMEMNPWHSFSMNAMLPCLVEDIWSMFEKCYNHILRKHLKTIGDRYLFATEGIVCEKLGLHSEFTRMIVEHMVIPSDECYIFDINAFSLDIFIQHSYFALSKDVQFARKALVFLVMTCRLNSKFATLMLNAFKERFHDKLEPIRCDRGIVVKDRDRFDVVVEEVNGTPEVESSSDWETGDDSEEDDMDDIEEIGMEQTLLPQHWDGIVDCMYLIQGMPSNQGEPLKMPFWHFVKVDVREVLALAWVNREVLLLVLLAVNSRLEHGCILTRLDADLIRWVVEMCCMYGVYDRSMALIDTGCCYPYRAPNYRSFGKSRGSICWITCVEDIVRTWVVLQQHGCILRRDVAELDLMIDDRGVVCLPSHVIIINTDDTPVQRVRHLERVLFQIVKMLCLVDDGTTAITLEDEALMRKIDEFFVDYRKRIACKRPCSSHSSLANTLTRPFWHVSKMRYTTLRTRSC